MTAKTTGFPGFPLGLVLAALFATHVGAADAPGAASTVTVRAGLLEVVFADNTPEPTTGPRGPGRPRGMNGIVSLRHASDPSRELFVPGAAGLNYEKTTVRGIEDESLEPRESPIRLGRDGPTAVVLEQDPLPIDRVAARLRFEVVPPSNVDATWAFTLHAEPVPPGRPWDSDFSALFASYIHRPDDPHAYVLGRGPGDRRPQWYRLSSAHHGGPVMATRAKGGSAVEAWRVRPELPCLAGRVGDVLLVFMVERLDDFGFWVSPNGGWDRGFPSPAWDLIVHRDGVSGGDVVIFRTSLAVVAGGKLGDVARVNRAWRRRLAERRPSTEP